MKTDSLDSLIATASQSRSDDDYIAVLTALYDIEVFFNVESVTDPDGKQASHIPMYDVGDGNRAMVVYTSSENEELTREFGGLVWRKFLEMVVAMPDVDGVVLKNREGAWVALARENLLKLLSLYAESEK